MKNSAIRSTIFQSTPPIRRATVTDLCDKYDMGAISIHAPHTEGDHCIGYYLYMDPISIHAPHTEGDLIFKLVNAR